MISMSTLLESPLTDLAETDRHAFNVAVWERLQADPYFGTVDFRIETDEHGQVIMSPPPSPSHGSKQSRISHLLRNLMDQGEVICECPISTSKGVKGADVAWCSETLWNRCGNASCFVECPELCIEVLSPSNTGSEISEEKMLYFEAGALEVWICDEEGRLTFFVGEEETIEQSNVFPGFALHLQGER